jgi:NADPH-dependent curcumin reductase CurA
LIRGPQIVYLKPPADGVLLDPASTFNVVHTPFDSAATNLQPGDVLVENQYLSIDPYHRFGLYDPAVTRSQFPVTTPGTVISTYGISRVLRSANPDYAVGDLLYSWVCWERFYQTSRVPRSTRSSSFLFLGSFMITTGRNTITPRFRSASQPYLNWPRF